MASRYTDTDQGNSSRNPPTEAEVVERFRERIRLFAARRVGDWAAADDVAQETLRRALESMRAGRIENMDALPAFLFQTAIHICQHRSRSAGRENRALARLGSAGERGPDDPLTGLITEERRVQVRNALAGLDPSDRDVLLLTYEEAFATAEIARRLNLSEGNVRVRRHRALKRLAELLGVTTGADRGLKV